MRSLLASSRVRKTVSAINNGGGGTVPTPVNGLTFDYRADGSLTPILGPAITFARTGNAWNPETGAITSTGLPRYTTGKSGQALLVSESATNLLLYSNKFNEAGSWQATDIDTIVQDQTSPFGAANTAWTVTALNDGGKLVQPVTSTSANRDFALWIKRVSGVGAVSMTVDNSTWTAKTLTTSWQRFDISQASVTNPVVGIQFATGGNAVAIYQGDLLSKDYPLSFIPTTTASVTTNAETASFNPTGVITAASGTISAWVFENSGSPTTAYYFGHGTTAANNLITMYRSSTTIFGVISNSSGTSSSTSKAGANVNQWNHYAMTWDSVALNLYVNGVAATPVATPNLPSVINTSAYIGARRDGAVAQDTSIDNVRIYNRALSATEIKTLYMKGR